MFCRLMIKLLKFIFLFSCTIPLSFFSLAQKIQLQDGKDLYLIQDSIDYYRDASESLTINEVSSSGFSDKFQKSTISFFDKDDLPEIYWVRLHVINNRSKENQSWYFESWDFDFDEIEFYVPDNKGGFFKTDMGYLQRFEKRNSFFSLTFVPVNRQPTI